MHADVIVVGLGTMGAATACLLAERGVRVIGVDAFAPPHSRGSHAGGSRIIRLAYAEGADYVPLLRRAYQMWSELEERTGTDLLTITGGLMLGRPGGDLVGGALAAARVHALPHELLDVDEIRRRFPAFTPAEDEVALYEEAAGLVRPEAAIAAYLRLAAATGADLRYGVRALGWHARPGRVMVSTSEGELTADRLVIAPGAWAGDLLADPAVPLIVVRRVQHFWRMPAPGPGFGDLPVWIWEYCAGLSAYGLPPAATASADDADPTSAGAKAALHDGHDPIDPSGPVPEPDPVEIAEMGRWLAERIPALPAAGHLGSKTCLYTLTPDEHFVIGAHPEHPEVSLACGFSGHGFKFAPVIGEILADLATTGATDHPIAQFDPARFGSGSP